MDGFKLVFPAAFASVHYSFAEIGRFLGEGDECATGDGVAGSDRT